MHLCLVHDTGSKVLSCKRGKFLQASATADTSRPVSECINITRANMYVRNCRFRGYTAAELKIGVARKPRIEERKYPLPEHDIIVLSLIFTCRPIPRPRSRDVGATLLEKYPFPRICSASLAFAILSQCV